MIPLVADGFDARISLVGGTLTRLHWTVGEEAVPLLRDAPDDAAATDASCFPLLPFGNRIRDNAFAFGEQEYHLAANTPGDRHALHGDGWLGTWDIVEKAEGRVVLGFSHPERAGSPYVYTARQTFAAEAGAFHLTLAVTNAGSAPLPFGIGWHPYFPLTAETTLMARAAWMRAEAAEFLPGERCPIPEDIDFAMPRKLPRRWVNNGFEAWDGMARIAWPERGAALTLAAGALFSSAVLFVSDERFDPAYRHEHFCFEPMSHLPGGHHLPDLGGLRALGPGETLSGSLRFLPERLA